MKKLLFLILFVGCNKDSICWTCRTDSVSYIGTTKIREEHTDVTLCDKTVREIFDYEASNTSITWTTEGNFTVKTVSECKCLEN